MTLALGGDLAADKYLPGATRRVYLGQVLDFGLAEEGMETIDVKPGLREKIEDVCDVALEKDELWSAEAGKLRG